jgi:hypothetical protein
LLRWQHPELGMVPPSEFIPLLEENHLIIPVGEWVLRTACAQSRAWQDAGLPPLRMAVNISARQFRQKNLVEMVDGILRETRVSPRLLELELTEGILMENTDETSETLNSLKNKGVLIAVDDFGTGYSSLGYLKRFPIDRLKIDRSFVRDIITDGNDAAIAVAIISMGRSMGISAARLLPKKSPACFKTPILPAESPPKPFAAPAASPHARHHPRKGFPGLWPPSAAGAGRFPARPWRTGRADRPQRRRQIQPAQDHRRRRRARRRQDVARARPESRLRAAGAAARFVA